MKNYELLSVYSLVILSFPLGFILSHYFAPNPECQISLSCEEFYESQSFIHECVQVKIMLRDSYGCGG